MVVLGLELSAAACSAIGSAKMAVAHRSGRKKGMRLMSLSEAASQRAGTRQPVGESEADAGQAASSHLELCRRDKRQPAAQANASLDPILTSPRTTPSQLTRKHVDAVYDQLHRQAPVAAAMDGAAVQVVLRQRWLPEAGTEVRTTQWLQEEMANGAVKHEDALLTRRHDIGPMT